MKYPVMITETFKKLIVVEADSEEEAINKCLVEADKSDIHYLRPTSIDPVMHDSDKIFEIGTDKDKELIDKFEGEYDHLS